MSNYYQNKFDDLKLKYEISEAINDICNLYLDNIKCKNNIFLKLLF